MGSQYKVANRHLLCNWFNCNPIHVLKSRYNLLAGELGEKCAARIPFRYGKEYLILGERDANEDNVMHECTSQSLWSNARDVEVSNKHKASFAFRRAGTYFLPVFSLI